MIRKLVILLFLFVPNLQAQQTFTQQDTLRGSITRARAWWDVQKYTLAVYVDPDTKSIVASNTIRYKILYPHQVLQFELQDPLVIDSIVQNKQKLEHSSIGVSHFVTLKTPQLENNTKELTIYYHGKPKEAKQAPWDGGFVWKKDLNNHHFIATANQSVGASIWWPCKDHPADEPESIKISVTCPEGYTNVSNGRNTNITTHTNGQNTFTWEVSNPINTYGVAINIAKYKHFSETFNGENGMLDCNYYVLDYNLNKAKTHFIDVPKTLKAFEYWFGAYPFYNDGYKLVETPYLGMEHQSCVAYGNEYKKGYLGKSRDSWGLKFDYIIIHETAHEWFANSITCKDVADLWIHESFATYAESLFLEYHFGKKAGEEYLQNSRHKFRNDKPIIGTHNVNHSGSSDMYVKGSLVLHTLRQLFNNDELWRATLRKLNKTYYHKTVTGNQIMEFLNQQIDLDLTTFFHQYLKTTQIPKLVLKQKGKYIYYKWENVIDGFTMPITLTLNREKLKITPQKNHWQKFKGKLNRTKVDPNFCISSTIH